MPEIKKVLVTVKLKPENMARLKEELSVSEIICLEPDDIEGIRKHCGNVDVAIFNSDMPVSVSELKEVRWIHCSHAGVEKSISKELFARDIILTSAKGRSAKALAEHSFMFLMALTYNLKEQIRRQGIHCWDQENIYPLKTGLYGKTIGVVGLGYTGKQVARLAKAFDMNVLGYRRSTDIPENVDEIYSSERGDSLREMLSRCDYIVLCIELNDSTHHLIGKAELENLRDTAILVNMGRGSLIDEKCLIEHLKEKKLFGAGLDTVGTEPLPEDSPLWDLDNVLLTPHVTPAQPDKDDNMLSFILRNIEAYRNGGQFVNRITERSLYTRRQTGKKIRLESKGVNT